MPDREQVIRGLEMCRVGRCDYRCPYASINVGCKNQLLDDAIALLKKQDAETVESIQISRNFYAELTGYCPSCKRPLKSQFNKQFCGNCGQEVKWDA